MDQGKTGRVRHLCLRPGEGSESDFFKQVFFFRILESLSPPQVTSDALMNGYPAGKGKHLEDLFVDPLTQWVRPVLYLTHGKVAM